MYTQELLSVVIPVFNAKSFLGDAIQSVCRQGYSRLDIIVIDDGSTDGSGEVASRFPNVRCLRQANLGIAAARNAGVKAARGSLLAFLDADDEWAPDKISRQVDTLARMPHVDIVAGQVEQFFDASAAAPAGQQPPPLSGAYTAGAMLLRRTTFLQVGWFNTELRVGEFIDWHSRAKALGLKEHSLHGVVLRRRIHANNSGIRLRESQKDYLSVIKAHLDRQRNAA